MNARTRDETAPDEMPALFRPITLRGLTIRNRIWVPPMCQYSVFTRDGVPADWHLVHLGAMAAGGAGLVIAEATAVQPEGRISERDTGLWNDTQASAWARIAAFIRSQGAAAGIQLAHAGRKASVWPEPATQHGTQPVSAGGWQAVAPSAIAFAGYAEPVALTASAIAGVIAAFRSAAGRARRAGFDLIEIHAAHGYLIHEFLSPLSNLRTDEWGGSLANRARLLLAIVREVRAEVGDNMPVFVRFSATDWVDGGWDEAQTATVAQWAREAGADLYDVSSGGLVPTAAIAPSPGYQVPLAERLGERCGTPVAAVGLIASPEQAADIVERGAADAVFVGREHLRDPHFAMRVGHALGVDHETFWAPAYWRGRVKPGTPF